MPVPEQEVVMRWLRWVVGLAVLLLVAWGGYWAVAIYVLDGALTECGNTVLQEVSSTDGHLVATAFERGCGATTAFTRIVNLRSAGTRFDGEDSEEWIYMTNARRNLLS